MRRFLLRALALVITLQVTPALAGGGTGSGAVNVVVRGSVGAKTAMAGSADIGSYSNGMSASTIGALDFVKHSPGLIEAARSLLIDTSTSISSGLAKGASITLGFINGAMIDATQLIEDDPTIVEDWANFRGAVDVANEGKEVDVSTFNTGGSAARQGILTIEELKELGL